MTVPRSSTIEDIDAEQAYTLLADKRAKGPAKKRGTRKTTKKTTKKTAAKKTTAKRATAKKSAAQTVKEQ